MEILDGFDSAIDCDLVDDSCFDGVSFDEIPRDMPSFSYRKEYMWHFNHSWFARADNPHGPVCPECVRHLILHADGSRANWEPWWDFDYN
jgi:hypothetical protein